MFSRHLHNVHPSVETHKGLFGIIIPSKVVGFFADDGFGNYVSFDNSIIQMFASTESLLGMTNEEREREESKIPNII
jgi:hypothetical protein